METLYLIRHGKSSWNFEELDDYDRPLGKRGRRDLSKMGCFVKENVPAPDLIITSGASRAFYTALHLSDYWKYPEENIIISEVLYQAGVSDFEKVLLEVQDFDTVALFGHNPDLTMLHNRLCEDYIDNIPTCGMVGLDVRDWIKNKNSRARRLFFHVPKDL